jgi:phage replication-related protein YjqB (UPF0714/DUF867 family)
MIDSSPVGQPLERLRRRPVAADRESLDRVVPVSFDAGGHLHDTYRDIAKLMLVESRHVTIRCEMARRSAVAIIAPHAGSIEPFTGELAEAIAGEEHRLYCFSGSAREDSHRLHVTSTRFSEPVLTRVLLGATVALTVHGCRYPLEPVTHLGGSNHQLRNRLERSLSQAGFAVDRALPPMAGRHPHNVVNRTIQGGVQLEISRYQRRALNEERRLTGTHGNGCSCLFCRYVAAIRGVLES